MCSTSVTDVTNATLSFESGFSGNVSYSIRHGICYVTINGLSSSNMNSSDHLVLDGLPKPETTHYYTITSMGNSSSIPLFLIVNTDGQIYNMAATNDVSYYGTFSYPVAE